MELFAKIVTRKMFPRQLSDLVLRIPSNKMHGNQIIWKSNFQNTSKEISYTEEKDVNKSFEKFLGC